MEILQIYEKAKEELEKSLEVSLQNGITISSITLILSDNDTCYTGVNWSRINDSFLIEQTCSEYEALTNLLFDGNTSVKTIVTLDASTKLPINPCTECQKLIVKINPKNISCSVITGDDSVAVLSELNPELAALVTDSPKEEAVSDITADAEEAKESVAESAAVSADETTDNNTNNPVSEDETKISPSSIDTSELKMIFDDWESTDETPNDVADTIKNKPFNVNSLSLSSAQGIQEKAAADNKQHAVFTQSAPPQNNNMYQQAQPVNSSMYQQPMNGMYQQQQPMNGMYQQQQQPMNGMYQQHPMNGMYQQQPMNGMYQQQPMNGMYQQQQQPMNGMYQQQPMNGMYQQQQQPMNGMYQQQQQPMNGMYNQQAAAATHANSIYMAPQQPQNNYANQVNTAPAHVPTPAANIPQPNTFNQTPINTIRPNAQTSTSVYGTNINSSDNNAIFKDRLNNLLSTHSSVSEAEDEINDVLQSAKDKKKAEKLKAKLKKQKKNEDL